MEFCPELKVHKRDFSVGHHYIGSCQSQLYLPAWEHELECENDPLLKEFLLHGITYGFDIVDSVEDIGGYEQDNYSSALLGESGEYVNTLILKELDQGLYIRTKDKPRCVHALGAVPKSDGCSFRPITDCRQPLGESINCHMDSTAMKFSYNSVDNISGAMTAGCYMAVLDIAHAYRSVSINPLHWSLQGIKWLVDGKLEYLLDTRICFGLRCAPFIFTRLSEFIVRCMHRRGYVRVFQYLDDFIIMEDSQEKCCQAQTLLIRLLHSLGFNISWKKVISPSQKVRFLGVNFDSQRMKLSLPEDKLVKLHAELRFFQDRSRATKRQLQRLCGHLSHCAKVIRGGRTFSNRIIALLQGLKEGNPRIKLSPCFKLDIEWWQSWSHSFNGEACLIERNFGQGPVIETDSCLQGYGAVSGRDWIAGFFNTSVVPDFLAELEASHSHWRNSEVPTSGGRLDINCCEIIPVVQAMHRWGRDWNNSQVLFLSDNTQVVQMINRGISASKNCMTCIRNLFWLSVKYNCHLVARYIPGKENVIPDRLSRLCFTNDWDLFSDTLLCCS